MSTETPPSAEELQEEIKKLEREVEKQRNESGYAKRKYDELSTKYAEDEKVKVTLAEKAGEYAKAKEAYESNIKTLQSEIDSYKQNENELERLKAVEKKYTDFIEAERASLIALLPENKRDECKDFGLETLRVIVSMLSDKTKTISSGSGRHVVTDKPWSDMTPQERNDYATAHSRSETAKKIAEGVRR